MVRSYIKEGLALIRCLEKDKAKKDNGEDSLRVYTTYTSGHMMT
jgi:hypothetical protein